MVNAPVSFLIIPVLLPCWECPMLVIPVLLPCWEYPMLVIPFLLPCWEYPMLMPQFLPTHADEALHVYPFFANVMASTQFIDQINRSNITIMV